MFVSCTSNLLEQMYDFQKCTMFLQKWILNQDLPQNRVLKQSQSALLSGISHMTILFVFTCMMNIRNQSIQALVTSFGSIVLWNARVLFTDHKISSRPILAKYKHFRTI